MSKPQSLEELHRRLEEAEETIRAIREGEIDALVVRRVDDEQVFTLHGGQDSYRAFMETMGHGAAALGEDGEIFYANSILAALIGKPHAQLQGRPFPEQFPARVSEQIRRLLADAGRSNDGAGSCEIVIADRGEERHFLASAEPLQTGVVNGWAVTLTDLTDRVRAEESLAAERIARAVIASANEAVVVCDPEGRITHVNDAVLAIQEGDLVGRPFHEAIPLTFGNTTGLVQAEELVRMAIAGDPIKGLEAFAPEAPRIKDLLVSAAPLSPDLGVVGGCVITLVDLSQRKAAEKQQMLLMAELDHRVKNTLTLVLSILGRTREQDVEEFKNTFAQRIQALAATHNLLAKNSWSTLSIGEIFSAELAPYVQRANHRTEQSGSTVRVAPRAAIALGLIFHELASNAAKYGAFSTEAGQVLLRVAKGDDDTAVVEWVERGGPQVLEPQRLGFGSTVITRSLSYSSSGRAELFYAPTGVRCVINIPVEDIVI